jgi:Family of unknown function (DUF6348)
LFEELLAGHGFTVTDGRVGTTQVHAQLIIHPRPAADTVMGQVDFAVQHPDLASPWLVESFAAARPTWHQAIGECVGKFQQSVLHTLITGLLDRTACADQVSWESYHHPGGDFDLCTGPHLQLFSDAEGPGPRGALDRMLGALRQTALARKIHWLRIFTCHDHRRLTTNEVLLDGEPWPAGESIMASLTPPTTSDLTGVRLFALLIPRQPDQGAALAIPRTQRITYPGGVRARESQNRARAHARTVLWTHYSAAQRCQGGLVSCFWSSPGWRPRRGVDTHLIR